MTQIDGKNENKSQFHFIFSRLFLFQFFFVEIANQRVFIVGRDERFELSWTIDLLGILGKDGLGPREPEIAKI